MFVALTQAGMDRVLPWPGDRPWNFVRPDGIRRRVDLHLYEPRADGWLQRTVQAASFTLGKT